MALPIDGTLTFSMIKSEIGLTGSQSLSDLVQASVLSDKTPPHSISQFYGYSHTSPLALSIDSISTYHIDHFDNTYFFLLTDFTTTNTVSIKFEITLSWNLTSSDSIVIESPNYLHSNVVLTTTNTSGTVSISTNSDYRGNLYTSFNTTTAHGSVPDKAVTIKCTILSSSYNGKPSPDNISHTFGVYPG